MRKPSAGGAPTRCVGESDGDELRMRRFERLQLVEERVVNAVRDLRIVEDVVAVVVVLDQPSELSSPLRAAPRS